MMVVLLKDVGTVAKKRIIKNIFLTLRAQHWILSGLGDFCVYVFTCVKVL